MKITMITPWADHAGGGVSEVARNLSNAFSSQGHHAELYGRLTMEQKCQSGSAVRLASNGVELLRALRSAPMDVLHSHGLWDPYLSLGIVSARRRSVPVVVSPHGMLDPWALRQGRMKKRLALATYEGMNLARAACIHALTEAEAAAIRRIIPSARIAVIPNGVSLPPLEGNPTREKMLLFLGRVHPKKGILELITAFHALLAADEARSWKLVIAGWDDGGHLAEVQERIQALGLGERVQYVGPVFGEDKSRLIAQCQAFALTSYSEGLPMAVLEVWAQGKPVMMTRECNLPEGEAAGAALICQSGTHGVTEGLRRFLSLNPEAHTCMGIAGRRLVEERFDWDKIARDYASLYAWLLGRERQPDFVN